MDVRYFEDKVTFVQRFILEGDYLVQGYFTYGACDDQSCLPPTNVEFKYEGKYTAHAGGGGHAGDHSALRQLPQGILFFQRFRRVGHIRKQKVC